MTELVRYEAARRALAEAVAADEVMQIRDEWEAIRLAGKVAKDVELQIHAAKLRFRAERRLGELVREQKKTIGLAKGGQPYQGEDSTRSEQEQVERPATLAEAGIDRKLSSKSQRLAAMDAAEFEQALERHEHEMRAGKGRVAMDLLKIGAEEKGRTHRRDLAAVLSEQSAALPTGRVYPCAYLDPPWKRQGGIGNRAYENHYPTMSWPEILAYLREARASLLPDSWAFMWIPRAHLLALVVIEVDVTVAATGEVVLANVAMPLAWACAQALGMDSYSTCFVWTKTDDEHPHDSGSGLIAWDQDELLLLFKRGRGLPKPEASEKFGSNHRERATDHSRKPEFYRHMIATMVGCDTEGRPLPVLEMFARVDAEHPLPPGWDACGNQAQVSLATAIEEGGGFPVAQLAEAKRARRIYPAGHTVATTNPVIDGSILSVGTCGCGEVFSFPWGDHHHAMDAAIEAHWQLFDALPDKVDGRGDPIESFAAELPCGETVTAAAEATSAGASAAAAVTDPASIDEREALKILSDFCHPRRAELADVLGPFYMAQGFAYQSGEHWSLRGAGWDRLRELDDAARPQAPAIEWTEPYRKPAPPQLSLDLAIADAPLPVVVDGALQTRLPVDEDELAEQLALLEIAAGHRVEGDMLRHLVGKGLAHCGITKISVTDEGRAFLAQLVSPAAGQREGAAAP